MKIGIDARFYGEAGPGRYVSQLLLNLERVDNQNDYTVYLKKSNLESYQPNNTHFKKALADFHWYSLAEQIIFPIQLYKENFDLVHFTQINVPLFYFRPFVVTVHDLILHEFSMARGSFLKKLWYRLKKIPYFLVFAKAVHSSRKIIVPSQTTKEDLLRYYKINPEKVVVTYEAVDHYPSFPDVKNRIEILGKYGVVEPYLLCLASFYPHKNLKRLTEAFKSLVDEGIFKGQLVLVGKESEFAKILREQVVRDGVKDVVFPGSMQPQGYLPDDEVEIILANADFYVQPSLKEGFGLPPVEAMVFGVPVAVANIDCLREMCGAAALYFDPGSVGDMVNQIKLMVENGKLREELIQKGYQNVKRFSWAKMARETLMVYNQSLKKV